MRGGRFEACIMGASLDTGNLGVSALAASLLGLVRKHRPGAECALFVGRRTDGDFAVRLEGETVRVPVINYRQSFRARFGEHVLVLLLLALLWKIVPLDPFRKLIGRLNPRIRKIASSDLVGDVRGGDSFSDIYGVRNMLLGSIPDLIVLLLGKELVYFPQTYGPYRSAVSRRVAAYLLRRARFVLSRDAEGIRVVEGLIGPVREAGRLATCPDVAFSLPVHDPDPAWIVPPLPACGKEVVVGLNVSGLLFNRVRHDESRFGLCFDYACFVASLAETLLAERPVRLLLVPHTFAPSGSQESDPDACRLLFRSLEPRFPGRVHLLEREGTASELKGVIGLCDFFVGSRMHACIGAVSQGIPTVGVAYSRKFAGVFETAGVGDWIVDARDTAAEDAVRRILERFDDRNAAVSRLEAGVPRLKEALDLTFLRLLGEPAAA